MPIWIFLILLLPQVLSQAFCASDTLEAYSLSKIERSKSLNALDKFSDEPCLQSLLSQSLSNISNIADEHFQQSSEWLDLEKHKKFKTRFGLLALNKDIANAIKKVPKEMRNKDFADTFLALQNLFIQPENLAALLNSLSLFAKSHLTVAFTNCCLDILKAKDIYVSEDDKLKTIGVASALPLTQLQKFTSNFAEFSMLYGFLKEKNHHNQLTLFLLSEITPDNYSESFNALCHIYVKSDIQFHDMKKILKALNTIEPEYYFLFTQRFNSKLNLTAMLPENLASSLEAICNVPRQHHSALIKSLLQILQKVNCSCDELTQYIVSLAKVTPQEHECFIELCYFFLNKNLDLTKVLKAFIHVNPKHYKAFAKACDLFLQNIDENYHSDVVIRLASVESAHRQEYFDMLRIIGAFRFPRNQLLQVITILGKANPGQYSLLIEKLDEEMKINPAKYKGPKQKVETLESLIHFIEKSNSKDTTTENPQLSDNETPEAANT